MITDEILIDIPNDVSNPMCRVMRLTKNRYALLMSSMNNAKGPDMNCVELALWPGHESVGDKLEVCNSDGIYKLRMESYVS